MTATTLQENYCVCVGDDGAPREIGRSGRAVTYKAMGYQSGQAVALQLIPLANVSEAGRAQFELKARAVRKLKHPNIARVLDVREEDDHLVFATEFLQGETAERWVVTHGPMPPDAVVRIGLQVVSALAEAAFHSLSHRAIQPSNLMIVSGAAPDGDWPFVKLLNFGLAGLKLYSEGTDELAPAIGAAFASPEQLEKGKVDFRSEIFSLGATMCFLLTGAVPLAGRPVRTNEGERILPSGAPMPRAVRRLLRRMLRINPDERPHDPLLVTDELRRCLKKVGRRRALVRQPALPPEVEELSLVREDRSPWLGPLLTAVTILLLLVALGALVWRGQIHRWAQGDRPLDSIGVPVGVDENHNKPVASTSAAPVAEESSSPAVSPPPPITSPEETVAPVIAEGSPGSEATRAEETVNSSPSASQEAHGQTSPEVAQETNAPVPTESPATTPTTVTINQPAEPPPPEEAPPSATASPPPENVAPVVVQQEPQTAPEQNPVEQPVIAPPSPKSPTSKTITAKIARAEAAAPRRSSGRTVPTMRVGTERARLVGTTGEGNWILRLPSGETIVTPPVPDTNDAPVISHRRVRKVKVPPRAVPAGGPPVLVLPPDN